MYYLQDLGESKIENAAATEENMSIFYKLFVLLAKISVFSRPCSW